MKEILRKRSAFLTFIILSLAVTVSGCSGLMGSGSTASSIGPELQPSHRFTLKGLSQDAVSLDQLLSKNKAVLVSFWATWCGYCVEEMPDLIHLQERLGARGFTVLAVNVGESAEQAKAFAEKMGLNFPVALDEDSTVAQNYGLVGIPTAFLIRTDGKVVGEYHGFTSKLVSDIEITLEEPSAA